MLPLYLRLGTICCPCSVGKGRSSTYGNMGMPLTYVRELYSVQCISGRASREGANLDGLEIVLHSLPLDNLSGRLFSSGQRAPNVGERQS